MTRKATAGKAMTGKAKSRERRLCETLMRLGILDAAPSVQIQAFLKGRKVVDLNMGEPWSYFDWASITKVAASVSTAMILVDERKIKLNDSLRVAIPELELKKGDEITVRKLLSHSAGLTWWKPYYLKASEATSPSSAWSTLIHEVLSEIQNRKVPKPGPSVYSDLDFFLLGEIFNRCTERTFGERWLEIADRLNIVDTFYHATRPEWKSSGVVWSERRRKLSAPTENDPWRGRVLKGEVHDENAASLGGAAPHAGLFGPLSDLSKYGLELRKLKLGLRSRLPASGAKFLKRSIPSGQGDWALGFMMPTEGKASCGPRFSSTSIGHTGFTGTSIWFDPKKDLLVTILSNRVHPTRDNTKFVQMRPLIHTLIVDEVL